MDPYGLGLMTKQHIEQLPGYQLRAICRSYGTKEAYRKELIWARDEIARRGKERNKRLGKVESL